MRRFVFLLTTIIALSVSTANAQKKGDMYAGGNIKVTLSTSGSNGYMSTGTYFSIAPEFAGFIADKVKIGGEISYEVSSKAHVVGIAPNVAYYLPIVEKLYYTPQLSLGGAFGVYSGYTAGIFTMTLGIGSFEYKPIEKLGVSISLVNMSYYLIDKTNSLNLNLFSSPTIGFHYYF